MFKDKKILLGITGGIAAYKAVNLASSLTKMGAEVRTIFTKNATELLQPLTVKSITHQPVVTELFNLGADIEHISLADWADITVIAPATANIIGKVASGIADDLLSTTIMATTSPVLFVPAMNIHMYQNPIVQRNIKDLTDLGYFFMDPEAGMLACGYTGRGRFPKVEEIIYYAKSHLNHKLDLVGRKFMITAGASVEKIDPMRFISNKSTGLMGINLARAAYIRGAEVKLIHADVSVSIPEYLNKQEAPSAEEMFQQVTAEKNNFDTIIMTAAVADYTLKEPAKHKIKKGENLTLELVRTKDILKHLGENRLANQTLVGFAAESENILENGKLKLKKKKADFIVANDLKVAGKDSTSIAIITKNEVVDFSGNKFEAANKILDIVSSNYEK